LRRTNNNNNNNKVVKFRKRRKVNKLKRRQRRFHYFLAFVRLLKLSLFAVFLYGFYLLCTMNFWLIEDVEINGLTKNSYHYVSKLISQENLVNENIMLINPCELKSKLENRRIFKEVEIKRSILPTSLQINFVERIPYIKIYEKTTSNTVFIDEEGIVLTSKPDNNKILFYTLNKINKFSITSEQLKVIKYIENLKKEKKISTLGLFDISNENNIILNSGGYKFLLGNLENFVKKINTIPLIQEKIKTTSVSSLIHKSDKNEIEYIDIRFWDSPVLKLKKGVSEKETDETKKSDVH